MAPREINCPRFGPLEDQEINLLFDHFIGLCLFAGMFAVFLCLPMDQGKSQVFGFMRRSKMSFFVKPGRSHVRALVEMLHTHTAFASKSRLSRVALPFNPC